MAVRRESRFPISEILAHTPRIPEMAQWGIFLRNHDELTLEMVTDEERDYMYAEYAKDPRMKANVGIRRRLAPLLENDRNQIELFTALLLSLPGSPVIYYGDEIGMGDNIWLNDRDAVRTPMQWTPDRNAGFSTADPGKLYLPVITSLVYHHNNINVEAQMASHNSRLHWLRAMLAIRSQHKVFGLGDYVPVAAPNEAILAFLRYTPPVAAREDEGETVLCLNNLSSRPQGTTITLPPRYADARVRDLFGGTGFPRVGADGTMTITMGSRDFFWFALKERDAS